MKKLNLKHLSIFFTLFTLIHCGSDKTTGSGGTGGTCETLASDVTVDPASNACTTSAGKWTLWTVDVDAKTAIKQCNIEETDLYANQADFNNHEGTSTVPGVTVTSNSDYVLTDTCASGSIDYSNPPTNTTFLFIWEKQ